MSKIFLQQILNDRMLLADKNNNICGGFKLELITSYHLVF